MQCINDLTAYWFYFFSLWLHVVEVFIYVFFLLLYFNYRLNCEGLGTSTIVIPQKNVAMNMKALGEGILRVLENVIFKSSIINNIQQLNLSIYLNPTVAVKVTSKKKNVRSLKTFNFMYTVYSNIFQFNAFMKMGEKLKKLDFCCCMLHIIQTNKNHNTFTKPVQAPNRNWNAI